MSTIELKNVEPTLADPVFGRSVQHTETFVSFAEAAKLPFGNANVRAASHAKKPWKAMLATVYGSPQHFHLLNRGVIFRAKKLLHDPKTKTLKVYMPEDLEGGTRYGVVDGGHTLDVVKYVMENRADVAVEQARQRGEDVEPVDGKLAVVPSFVEPYVRMRFVVGEELTSDMDTIVESLNTSTQVQQFTLDEYHGAFDDLKAALRAADFDVSKVAFRENDSGDWDVREIIQRLTIFLKERWATEPPVSAYKNRTRTIKLFTDEATHGEYAKLYPHVLVDCLTMPEAIASELSLGEGVSRRKLGQLPGSRTLAKPTMRAGTTFTTAHQFDNAVTLPLAAAFRELLEVGPDGAYRWSMRPDVVLREAAQDLYDLYSKRARAVKTGNALGSDVEYWTAATSVVLRACARVPRTKTA